MSKNLNYVRETPDQLIFHRGDENPSIEDIGIIGIFCKNLVYVFTGTICILLAIGIIILSYFSINDSFVIDCTRLNEQSASCVIDNTHLSRSTVTQYDGNANPLIKSAEFRKYNGNEADCDVSMRLVTERTVDTTIPCETFTEDFNQFIKSGELDKFHYRFEKTMTVKVIYFSIALLISGILFLIGHFCFHMALYSYEDDFSFIFDNRNRQLIRNHIRNQKGKRDVRQVTFDYADVGSVKLSEQLDEDGELCGFYSIIFTKKVEGLVFNWHTKNKHEAQMRIEQINQFMWNSR